MNDEPPITVGKHSIGCPHNGVDGSCRELVVGHDRQEPVLRCRAMMSRELGKRFDPMPVAELVAAVIAIYEAIIPAVCALIFESRIRVHQVLYADFLELDLVKR